MMQSFLQAQQTFGDNIINDYNNVPGEPESW